MVDEILTEQAGKKVILLGNEAIVRGALESGVQVAATYPGTPASEIGDTFARVSKQAGVYFEYSTNEKVAFEVAYAAALCGVRSLVSFKHFGLNVASDSVFPSAYIGVNAGMVIAFSDDPQGWSSAQSEQDSRLYARLMHLPMLEPSDPNECRDFTKLAFNLSEQFKIPVFIRETTRVSHTRSILSLGKLVKGQKMGKFVKDVKRYTNMPPYILEVKKELLRKMGELSELSDKSPLNFVLNANAKSKLGIICSGVSYNYVVEAMEDLKLKLPVLKIGFTYPLPEKRIKSFIKNFKSVLVVEELDPVLEMEVARLAKEANPKLEMHGKDLLPSVGEYGIEMVTYALCKLTGKKPDFDYNKQMEAYRKLQIKRRSPVLCAGCGHRATFYAAKIAAPDAIFAGDIGCYILAAYPPLEAQDTIFDMGASMGTAHGIKKVSEQKVIAFIGDSTFIHAGLPGLINMSYNKSNPLVIVLDNRITAMTGHQPNPSMGVTGTGEQTEEIKLDELAKACGVKHIKVVDPYNVKEMIDAIKEFLSLNELAVIIAKRECRLLTLRKARRAGTAIPKFQIDQNLCKECLTCVRNLGCPAVQMQDGKVSINEELCAGCAVCLQICPHKAVRAVK